MFTILTWVILAWMQLLKHAKGSTRVVNWLEEWSNEYCKTEMYLDGLEGVT